MKIYEVNNTIGRTYYASKAAATGAHRIGKFEHGEDVTTTEVEFNLTKKGVVSMLNRLSYVPPQPEPRTTIRVTANKPPVPMSPEDIDQIESWGLGEIAKKCPTTKKWLDAKEAEGED